MYTTSEFDLKDCGTIEAVAWPASGQNRLLALNYVRAGEERTVCAAHEAWGVHFQTLFSELPPLPKPQSLKRAECDPHCTSSSKDRDCTQAALRADDEGEAAHICSLQIADSVPAELAASFSSTSAAASPAVTQCPLQGAILQSSAAELHTDNQTDADCGIAGLSAQDSSSLPSGAAVNRPLETTRRLTVRIIAPQLWSCTTLSKNESCLCLL